MVPDPGPGVCHVCRGPAADGRRVCFACRVVARRLGPPLAPVVPVRLCPLPSPLYTVLLGYKESPVAEARRRFGAIVRALVRSFLLGHAGRLEATVGGPFDLVLLVPSTHRPGTAPLGLVDGLGVRRRRRTPHGAVGSGSAATGRCPGRAAARRAHAAGPGGLQPARPGRDAPSPVRARSSSTTPMSVAARSQSAASALGRAGARSTLIVPIGRVLRPDRVALHADFLRRHAA